ncbi:MAG TPA: UDP-N-acetylglucosamine--N-acetylmuramyl-(pentapeptide) pyrophosphoryl-undecaprenol N-acetylglucosamine transferase [Gemmatimonadaceae bacterium]|nr:UDP-N-acetylglucosamine--N-acetylmuramyl-(pentapeptide) pyrophosphoryl-undecaprenol N-acetylglucosamine transferase [Gemmatimonadaceae bacterium]
MRILFAGGGTGGHLYPGLAIARAVQRLRPDAQPFFIGARRGVERDVLPTTGYPYALLDLHPLYRTRVWNNWRTLTGMFTAWRGIGRVVRDERPAVIVGTGGYAAVAALAYGVLHRIPIVEQTGDSIPSLTARLFSRWSREVYLSFPESAHRLRARTPHALIDTGAPIEPPPDPRPPRSAALRAWKFPDDALVVLVYGGSQGSLAINTAVRDWIARGLPANVHLIWGTGKKTFDEFKNLESDRVRVRPYLAPIADAYAAADLAVARAGTMTLAELFAWNIPAILIPLPTAAADHQTMNARTLEQAGAAVHLSQSQLSGDALARTIASLLGDRQRLASLRRAAAQRARPGAAAEIARRVVAVAEGTVATR